jgi:glycosyltransferase involved in cell wall biosynthesis
LVKEADAFSDAGYHVTVLYTYVADWAQVLDKNILEKAKWKSIQVGGESKAAWKYQISRIRFAFYRLVNEKISVKLFAEKAHARCYNALLEYAIKLKADWYIGHNPGAMAIAANAAIITNAKAGFDFEDYYRGEYIDLNSPALKRQIFIENKYFSNFNYLSAASKLIGDKVDDDFKNNKIQIETITNCFSKINQPYIDFSTTSNEELKLFWFSQHVGLNRGLQIVFEVLKDLGDSSINLTLVGNCTSELSAYFKSLMGNLSNCINFVGVIPANELSSFSSLYDIGLALEPAFSINNDLALSNKIFTYLLAGNAIIFSETSMQKKFNEEFNAGLSFPINDKEELKKCILFYKNRENLLKQRKHNYELAKEKLNWENESQKLFALVN